MKIFLFKTCVCEYNERIFTPLNNKSMKAIITSLVFKLGLDDLDIINLPENWKVDHLGKTITKNDLIAFCLGQI